MIDLITPFVALTQPENYDVIIAMYVGVLLFWAVLFLILIGVVLYK